MMGLGLSLLLLFVIMAIVVLTAPRDRAPLRRIVKREPGEMGELIWFECGHGPRYTHGTESLQYWRCQDCGDAIRKRKA